MMVSVKTVQGAALALAALALVGCGKAPLATVPKAAGAMQAKSSVVGLPTTYVAGQPVHGMPGTPSVIRVDWPRISKTKAGKLSDPVNLVICGDERHVRHVFGATGWLGADPVNLLTGARTTVAALTGAQYPTSPMSELFLFDRKQDMSFQKAPNGTRERDHLRIWKTPSLDALGRPVWVVAATEDIAIKMGPGDKLPTHQISPFIDDERQKVVDDLVRSGHVQTRYQLQSLEPGFRGVNGGGDPFTTDGKVEVLELVPMKFS